MNPHRLLIIFVLLLGLPISESFAQSYKEPPGTRIVEIGEAEPFCPKAEPEWRNRTTIDGIEIQQSLVCDPDSPYEVAAFVKGTNNIGMGTLMETLLSPDAVIKSNDRDGDGDPDEIHIRLEVVELNGYSPDIAEPVPSYFIAPGVQPGFWAFAPKTRGMSSKTFIDIEANRLLRLPSPVIRVEQGDTIKVTLENSHYFPHTIHFHGVDHPFVKANGEGNDGVPQTSEPLVLPGEARTYEMTPRQPGTMAYHCHVQPQVHILMGLVGMFVVEENRENNWVQTLNVGAGQVRHPSAAIREDYQREYDLQYMDIDKELHNIIQTSNDPRVLARAIHRGYNITDRNADYFMLNGRSFPYTLRESLIVVAPDEHTKIRMLNSGGQAIAVHTHGHKVKITHYDGVEHEPRSQITRDVVSLAPLQRLDLDLNTENDGLHSYGEGIWLFHDHFEHGVTTNGMNPGGGVSQIVYESFLGPDGMPKMQGVNNKPYWTKEYYQRKLPVWIASEEPSIIGALDGDEESMAGIFSTQSIISLAILVLFGVGVMLLSSRANRRDDAGD